MKKFFNKEVTWSMFVKVIICINAIILGYCYALAKAGDQVDSETLQYLEYLEHRVEIQEQLLEYYKKD